MIRASAVPPGRADCVSWSNATALAPPPPNHWIHPVDPRVTPLEAWPVALARIAMPPGAALHVAVARELCISAIGR